MALESGQMSEDTGVWAYAITEDGYLSGPDGEVDLSWLTGVGETKVRTTASCGLAVLVSDVSLTEFGEAALRENLDNLDWLDEVAQEHHYVIDAAARLFPLLPVRLATVYSGDDAVCAALTARGSLLRDALQRVGGRVEWGVKAYAAPGGEDHTVSGGEDHTAPAVRTRAPAAKARKRERAAAPGSRTSGGGTASSPRPGRPERPRRPARRRCTRS
jgi:hypothetical protein